MLYASGTIALACLEALVHLGGASLLPLNRYLVRIDLPAKAWRKRVEFEPAEHVGWDAEPPGAASLDWGTRWAEWGKQLIALVPSVIVSEEHNILINPRHPESTNLQATKIRRWSYDLRPGNATATDRAR